MPAPFYTRIHSDLFERSGVAGYPITLSSQVSFCFLFFVTVVRSLSFFQAQNGKKAFELTLEAVEQAYIRATDEVRI